MDCRETQRHLTAFHDGELPDADRARVEDHLRGCPECVRLRDDLARADEAAGVPDPGPGYWDRFNARVADRIEREAEGPKVSVLRPKQGWVRQQFRFLVPAVAAAALVMTVVRYGGQSPVAPVQTVPPAVAVKEKPALDPAGQRVAKADIEPPAAKKTEDAAVTRSVPAETYRAAEAPAVPLPTEVQAPPPPAISKERFPAAAREERYSLADRYRSEEKEHALQDRAAAAAPATEPQLASKAESASGTMMRRDVSPCEKVSMLVIQNRLRDAEAAQRECLAHDSSAFTQEKNLIFLAELLDRQARFTEADAVLAEVNRQFPKSRLLDRYHQKRPMVQNQQMPVPATR
jgi:hypothetical protein